MVRRERAETAFFLLGIGRHTFAAMISSTVPNRGSGWDTSRIPNDEQGSAEWLLRPVVDRLTYHHGTLVCTTSVDKDVDIVEQARLLWQSTQSFSDCLFLRHRA